jgi:hypothetical protein
MEEPTTAVGQEPVVEATNETPQVETEEVASTQEVETPTPDQVTEEQLKESESKGSRTQRRIEKLLEKTRQREEPPKTDVFGQNLPPWWQTQAPAEGDELTMEQLNQKMMTVAQLAVAQERQRNDFLSNVNRHNGELEEIAKAPEFENKDFDERFARLYQTMNYDDSGQFKPKATPKEIYDILKGVATLGEAKGQAESSMKMAQTIANAAVTPTQARTEDPSGKLNDLFEEARESGSTEKWAEYLKKSMPKS